MISNIIRPTEDIIPHVVLLNLFQGLTGSSRIQSGIIAIKRGPGNLKIKAGVGG
jgi:hypothetical protein